MTESGEVRLVPMSEAQRNAMVAYISGRGAGMAISDVVAAWDAAEPGVVDARWAEVLRLADAAIMGGEDVRHPLSALLDIARIARAAAGGERPSVSLRENGWHHEPDGYWWHLDAQNGRFMVESDAIREQIKREAEEGERDE